MKYSPLSSAKVLLLALTAFAHFSCEKENNETPAPNPQARLTAKIDSVCRASMSDNTVPGMSVVVVKQGQVLFNKSYGVSNLQTQQPVTADTRFHTGSTNKAMTAIAVMQLVDRGLIQINRKVTEYLPDFRMADARYQDITVEHLLTNSSGIEYGFEEGGFADDALEQQVAKLANQQLRFSPGQGYEYANAGWSVLGLIVQRLSRLPYENYMQANVFQRLGMNNTTLAYWTPNALGGTQGYVLSNQNEVTPLAPFLNRGYGPAGMVISTSNDIGKYLLMLLARGRNSQGEQILSESSVQAILTPHVDAESEMGYPSIRYGYGWEVVNPGQGKAPYLAHGGAIGSMAAVFILDPNQQVGVGLLFNRVDYNKVPVADAIRELATSN
ncbi:beta-lactamase family protein [Hymenobacter sp. BT664]|uniref:Beta-lactamase family protein n=1 Tax=Hymenobacter montanus TaxID=2771359 RepID=A0A927GIP4_9BACT|nr:serine hydrolase domain-containing protein [Hymenobacter montanus]MBD2767291.1 beta-lactamase family protein [Hymenobacter montanus]